ncbi:MAG: hypothetical protein P8H97_03070 [Pseudomonadales bacterium]|nr:hypothetical protein [Pseudomonadales bacterium]
MKENQTWHPLLIAGTVLLLNAFIFFLLGFSFNSGFYGVAIGCSGAGIALCIIGIQKNTQSNR